MKNVVTIGGGTGSFMLLTGLKKYPLNISAIVSMADDGGSTGVLRDELGVLPPGDVRQCLVALSESSDTLRELMNYRFEKGGLRGHNFGNLLLSALEKIKRNFSAGIEEMSKILNVRGEVIPVSEREMRLVAVLKNGKLLNGQKQLDHNEMVRKIGLKKVFIKPRVLASRKALKRIKEADFIIIGPGDYYGSIVPNFLVSGIGKAVKESAAKVIFNCNLTNKKGQTKDFNLDCYVRGINSFIGPNRVDFVTFNNENPNSKLLKKYESREGKDSMVRIPDANEKREFKIIRADLLQKAAIGKNRHDLLSGSRSFIRHDSEKLSRVLMMIMELGNYENIIRDII